MLKRFRLWLFLKKLDWINWRTRPKRGKLPGTYHMGKIRGKLTREEMYED